MNIVKSLTVAGLALGLFAGASFAEGQKESKPVDYSFEGPFGHWDIGQLQRGYKVYKEVCANCHSMNQISFRNLYEGGIFSEEQVKELAKSYTVKDGPDGNGEMFDRPGRAADRFPAPFPNKEAAQAANGGAYPSDLSLITKARAGWTGTWRQLYDGIGGPEYVYSVLTGYGEEHEGEKCPEGKSYNPYFAGGHCIGMPLNGTLAEGSVTFDDGAPNKVEDMSRDVSAFLAWTAEPKMIERKSLGFKVVAFLLLLTGLLYFVKQRVWSNVGH